MATTQESGSSERPRRWNTYAPSCEAFLTCRCADSRGFQLEITPLGAGNEVGRSCIILKYKQKTVMVRPHCMHALGRIFHCTESLLPLSFSWTAAFTRHTLESLLFLSSTKSILHLLMFFLFPSMQFGVCASSAVLSLLTLFFSQFSFGSQRCSPLLACKGACHTSGVWWVSLHCESCSHA